MHSLLPTPRTHRTQLVSLPCMRAESAGPIATNPSLRFGSAALLGLSLAFGATSADPVLAASSREPVGHGDQDTPATSSGDITVGNVTYTVTDVGAHGWFDPSTNQTLGSGFRFGGGASALYHGGLILATAADQVRDAAYGSDDNGITTTFDFGADLPVELGSAPGIDQYAFATFAYPPSPTPFAAGEYCVRQFAYGWSAAPNNDYVIVEFEITRTGGSAGDLYVGWYTDWDIGAFSENNVAFDPARRLGYMADASSTDPNVYGVAALSHSLSGFRAVDNPVYVYADGEFAGDPGFEDADKFDFLTGFDVTSSGVNQDWSMEHGVGPFSLEPGETVRVAFAMAAGTNVADLRANVDAAQSKWSGGITQPILSRAGAIALVQSSIISGHPREDLLRGYAPLCQLGPSVPIFDEDPADGRHVHTTTDLSWLIWLDLTPIDDFGHPTRHVVVNARTHSIQVNREGRFWPTVNGVALYKTFAARFGSADLFYTGANSPESGTLRNGSSGRTRGERPGDSLLRRRAAGRGAVVPGLPPGARSGLSPRDRAVLEDLMTSLRGDGGGASWGLFVAGTDTTTEPARKANIDCAYESLVESTFRGPGIPDSNVTFMNNPTKEELCDMIDTLPQDCDKFYVYWTGHGIEDTLVMNGGDLPASELADKLASLGAKEYCTIITTCHSGSFLDELADAGLNGTHMTSADAESLAKKWNEGGAFIGGWFDHFLWQCFQSGLEGLEAFNWAADTLKAYSDSIFAANPEWGMGYQGPSAGTVLKFGESGQEKTIEADPASCQTLCFDFRDDGDPTHCGNSTVYCEVDDGGTLKWVATKIWNWNLGEVRYLHAFGAPGATGKYKVAAHSNAYPVNVLVRWLPNVTTPETPTSAPVFPAYSLGWTDRSPGEFRFESGGGGIHFYNFGAGATLFDLASQYGTPDTPFFNTLAVQFPLVVDPERPWIYESGNAALGYDNAVVVLPALSQILNSAFQSVDFLIMHVEAWQGGVPIAQQDMQAQREPISGRILVEPWPIPAPVLAQPLEIRVTPVFAPPAPRLGVAPVAWNGSVRDLPDGALAASGAILILDSIVLDLPVTNTTDIDPPLASVRPVVSSSPNPFRTESFVRLGLPSEGSVRLSVYDTQGRLVRPLLDGVLPDGLLEMRWDGRDLNGRSVPVGVYLYRLDTPTATTSSKTIRIR